MEFINNLQVNPYNQFFDGDHDIYVNRTKNRPQVKNKIMETIAKNIMITTKNCKYSNR